MRAAFEKPERRFGDGFLRTVLVEVVKQTPFAREASIQRSGWSSLNGIKRRELVASALTMTKFGVAGSAQSSSSSAKISTCVVSAGVDPLNVSPRPTLAPR